MSALALVFADELAAFDGGIELRAGIEVNFSFSRFKANGAFDDGPLFEFDDLFAFEGFLSLDGDGIELGGGKDCFMST